MGVLQLPWVHKGGGKVRVTFKDVLNRAYTTLFTDYKLDNLIKMDEQAFYTFLGGFLCNSIDLFDGALTDLSYH